MENRNTPTDTKAKIWEFKQNRGGIVPRINAKLHSKAGAINVKSNFLRGNFAGFNSIK